ncbi:MAG: ABC transporter permease, partial [Chloroflexota bacterium]
MNKVISIALNDLRIFFRERGQLIGLIVIPLVFTFGVGFASSGNSGPSKVRVDVIDNDNSAYSQQFLADVRAANSALALCPMDNDKDDFCQLGESKTLDEEASVKRVTNNDTLALIEVPAGFGAAVQAGEPTNITYKSNDNVSAPSYILQAVQAAVGKMGTAQVAATVGSNIVADVPSLVFKDDADKQAFRHDIYKQASDAVSKNPITVTYTLSQAKD